MTTPDFDDITTMAAQAEPSDTDQGRRTAREDWIDAAMTILTEEGVEKLKVMELAQRLGVSRSSFYWFFKSRKDLLDQLLHVWEHKNTASIVERAKRPAATVTESVLNVFECWVTPRIYDPQLDFAIREWARRSLEVRRLVDAADQARITAVTEMFERHGYDRKDAYTRARVLYFMQIGYYALAVKEPMSERLSYVEDYVRSFTGTDALPRELKRFRAFTDANT